jgi:hypothetical protein
MPGQAYFREALSLVDSVNSSAVQALFADNVGREVTVAAVKCAFDAAFGVGVRDVFGSLANKLGPDDLSPRSPPVWALDRTAT